METIKTAIQEAAKTLQVLTQEAGTIQAIAQTIVDALKNKKKVVLFGNGGSASDAQHFAAELVGRYEAERQAFPAIALTANTSNLTAIGNDYGFDRVFARQVEALVESGDVVIGISTSGRSPNVLAAVTQAKAQGAKTVGLTGQAGGSLKPLVDICLCVPSTVTSHVQEGHITAIHAICRYIDVALAPALARQDLKT